MPSNRKRRGTGPAKESAPRAPVQPQPQLSWQVRGPLEPAVAVAAFRGALAMDAKMGGEPLLSEVSSHLESMTKAVLSSQGIIDRATLIEAIKPILDGSWEGDRICRFCDTCWEAARKAVQRQATQEKPPAAPRKKESEWRVMQRALAILAESHAQELVEEEEEQISRAARRAARAGRAATPEVAADEVDDASEPSSASSDDLRVRDQSNPFSVFQDVQEGEEANEASNSAISKPRFKDRCKWTVKSYKNGTETTWDVLESDGHLQGMRIVGKEPVQPTTQAECGRHKGGSDSKEERDKSVTLSYSETAEEEQSISMIRTVSSGTAARLLDLEDERRRDFLEGLDEGSASERSVTSAAKDWRQNEETPLTAEAPASRPSPVWSSPPPVAPPAQKRPSPLGAIGTAVADSSDTTLTWRPQMLDNPLANRAGCSMQRTPSLPSRLEPASPCPPSLTSPVVGEGAPCPLPRRRVGSHDVASGSFFSRQMSLESFSTEREQSSSATPAALFPSTPDFCPSPAGNFMLPPLQPAAPVDHADDVRAPGPPQVIYVPVFIPHRCRNCGHQCQPDEMPQELPRPSATATFDSWHPLMP